MLIDAKIGVVLHRTAPIVSVMVFGFAALVFSLLVCLWTLRMLRSAMPA
jgi:tellurite resistance protein TehA-like permease